ncbi:MAG: phosphatase PAP2 family protein [Planctomycetaceae bacterium]|nr:MAG: phosphatase PAP2 family protein [Planctomycetaceae bacterium]
MSITKLYNFLRGRFRQEVVVLVLFILAVVGILCFTTIADGVTDRATQSFDEWVLLSVRSGADSSDPLTQPWLLSAAKCASALASAWVLLGVTVISAALLVAAKKHKAAWLLLITTTGGAALSVVLKVIFDRPRPILVPHLEVVSSPSFPSAHAMLAAVLYLTLGVIAARFMPTLKGRITVLLIAVVLMLLIGASRVFLGVHYPTDVLAGWAIGAAWAILCWIVIHKFISTDR